MHIDIVPNRNSKPAVLLRESYREGKNPRKRTLANLSKLPMDQVESMRRILKGEKLVSAEDVFEIIQDGSRCHGHLEAVLSAMRLLRFDNLIRSRSCRERDLVVALVAARILEPQSKLATSLWWHTTTLPEILGISDATENDLYAAMDWLLPRQPLIEKKLAARHLENDALALYDLTSSYFEGVTCPLATFGFNRDGKKDKLQVNYGLLTNQKGIPVSVSVFEGNTADPKTLLPQVQKVQEDFGIERFILVGDRGMITQKQIDALGKIEGLDWITALRSEAIGKLVNEGAIQMGLFDERNLFELMHPDFPDERLVACRNPELAKRRSQKRQELLEATGKELEKVRQMVQRNRLHGKEAISGRVHKVLQEYKVGKYYKLDMRDDGFDFEVDETAMTADKAHIAGGSPPACCTADRELANKQLNRCKRHVEKINKQLDGIRQRIGKGQLYGKDKIGVRVGKVLNKYKVGKHFKLDIGDDSLEWVIDEKKVAAEAILDGIYVIRTSLSQQRMKADDTVRSYKLLTQVERAFRSFKTIDLKVRPIRHHLENRVRAHIFLCMLAYYVEWHIIEAWRPLLFCDEDQEAKATRDPVAPAKRSEEALRKAHTLKLDDESPVHSFRTLLTHLGSIVRNKCRRKGAEPDEPTFEMTTSPNPKQQRAYDLLQGITV
jgi:transposase